MYKKLALVGAGLLAVVPSGCQEAIDILCQYQNEICGYVPEVCDALEVLCSLNWPL